MAASVAPDPIPGPSMTCEDAHCSSHWSSNAFEAMLDPNCAVCIDPSWLDGCQQCEDAAADHEEGRAPTCQDESACNACEVLPAVSEMDEAGLQQLLACCCHPTGSPTTPRHFLCEWRGCNHYFHSQGELSIHVNTVHLGTPEFSTTTDTSSRASSIPPSTPYFNMLPFSSVSSVPDKCRWDDCQAEFKLPNDPSDRSSVFIAHLVNDHLRSAPPASTTAGSSQPAKSEVVPGVHVCHWVGCHKTFSNTADLTMHVADDHVGSGKGSYTCGWEGCPRAQEGRIFTQRQKVLRHMQTHTGDKPYKCPLCDKAFAEATTLTQHQRTHTNEKPYECTECGKSFALASALTIHMRTHTGDKPFKCPHPGCFAAFAESSNLRKHIRIHSGDRPFTCSEPGCGKAFQRSDQLHRHMRVHGNT